MRALPELRLAICFLLVSAISCLAQVPLLNWIQQAGGSGQVDARAIAVDRAGNSFVAGGFSGSVMFASNTLNSSGENGNGFMFIAKFSQNGNPVWGISPTSGNSYAECLAVDGSSNVYVCGSFYSPSMTLGGWALTNTNGNNFIAKLDPVGTVVWVIGTGGTNSSVSGIVTDLNGFLYLTGSFQGQASFGGNYFQSFGEGPSLFLAKASSNGVIEWAKQATASSISGAGVALDSGGNIYVSGTFSGGGRWGNQFEQTNLVSKGSSDLFLAKYDNAGRIIWVIDQGNPGIQTFGGGVALGSDNSPVLVGTIQPTNVFAPRSSLVAKYSTGGNQLWMASLASNTFLTEVAMDASNSVFVTGWYQGSPAFGSTNLPNATNDGLLLAQYASSGNLQWATGYSGSQGSAVGYALSSTVPGHLYVTGIFGGTVAFGNDVLTSAADYDMFLADLKFGGSPGQPDVSLRMYPGLTITGVPGSNYTIQYSTSLNTNWQTLTNIVLPYSPFLWCDTSPLAPSRFYRVQQP